MRKLVEVDVEFDIVVIEVDADVDDDSTPRRIVVGPAKRTERKFRHAASSQVARQLAVRRSLAPAISHQPPASAFFDGR